MGESKWPPKIDTFEILGGAMSFAVALAWNETAKNALQHFVPAPKDQLSFILAYAVFITLLFVFFIYAINVASDVADRMKNRRKSAARATPPVSMRGPNA